MSSDFDSNPKSWNLHCCHRLTYPGHHHSEQVDINAMKLKQTELTDWSRVAMAGNAGGPDDRQLPTSVGAKDGQLVKTLEDSMNKRAKLRERALIFEQTRTSASRERLPPKNVTMIKEQMRTSNREKLPPNNKGNQQQNGQESRLKMEVMREERSQEDALDDLKMKNIKTILTKLLNKTGLGKYIC